MTNTENYHTTLKKASLMTLNGFNELLSLLALWIFSLKMTLFSSADIQDSCIQQKTRQKNHLTQCTPVPAW